MAPARIDGRNKADVEREPIVMLLKTAESASERISFGAPPEPSLFGLASPEVPPENKFIVQDEIAYVHNSLDVSVTPWATLPEPDVPVREIVLKQSDPGDAVKEPVVSARAQAPVADEAAPSAGVRKSVAEVSGDPPTPQTADTIQLAAAASSNSPAISSRPERGMVTETERLVEEAKVINEITASLGESLLIPLAGRGWIFTSRGEERDAVPLLSRTITEDKTIFEFGAEKIGEFILEFQLQDNVTGGRIDDSIAIHVKDDVDLHQSVAESAPSGIDGGAPQSIAEVIEDPPAGSMFLPHILSNITIEDRTRLEDLATLYNEAGLVKEYTMCLEKYVELFPKNRRNDYRYFELGRLYETEELRNERKARKYYTAILEQYPASLYYLDAKARVHYLDRHFFDLR